MKIPGMIKREKKKEDDTNNNNIKYYEHWNYWKFQIHWNNLEWVVPKSCNVKKNNSVHIPTIFI